MTELIKDYYDKPVGEYLNRTVTINNVELACDIYRVAPETVLTPSVFTGCTAVDANTQIVIGRDMSVASGTTLIPPYRCKGIIIGDVGTFTNEGTISMTARGASGAGKNIQLTADYMISAVGGAGGAAKTITGYNVLANGNNGSSPASGILSCGGGASGGVSSYSSGGMSSGAGGSGTSFSGGAGGAGTAGTAGSSTGGAGGSSQMTGTTNKIRGGAGNPIGSDTSNNRDSYGTGTGGLIVILADNLVSSGNVEAKGSQGPGINPESISDEPHMAGGGASGGGCVILLSRQATITGTNSAAGGNASANVQKTSGASANGGAGGAGSVATLIVEDLILQNLPVEFAITDKAHLDNIEPSEAVRFIGLTDDDELQYDIMGKRHRAMNTEAEIDFSKLPSRGQRTPDAFEVDINNPQDGQVMRYNATNEQWENGDDYHVYSTNERVVGKWIDGKDLYEKTLHIPLVNNNGAVDVPKEVLYQHNIDNVDFIFVSSGTFVTPNNSYPPVWTVNPTTNFLRYSELVTGLTRTGIYITTYDDRSTWKLIVTLRYTKTTDTV